jgi:hypothetical protein
MFDQSGSRHSCLTFVPTVPLMAKLHGLLLWPFYVEMLHCTHETATPLHVWL